MIDFATSAPIPGGAAMSWLLTYAVHSTVILAGVWLLTRRGPLASPHHVAALWKAAAVAGVVTATVQTGTVLVGTSGSRTDAFWIEGTGPEPLRATFTFVGSEEGVQLHESAFPGASDPCRSALRERIADARANGMRGGGLEAVVERCASERRARVSPWVILGLWTAGALFMSLRLIRGHRRFADALDPSWPAGPRSRTLLDELQGRTELRGSVSLVEAPGLGSPVVLWGRRIALPAHALGLMDDGELSAALAHELGHVVRRDPGWLLVLRVLEAVFFFQPLNRLARAGFQSASDFLADEWAVQHTGEPFSLARSLEKVSAWANTGPADGPVLAMARRDSPIVHRVRRIVTVGGEASGRQRFGPASTLVLLPALLLPPVWAPAPREVGVVVIREFEVAPPPESTPNDGVPIVEVRTEHRVTVVRALTGS